MQHIIVVGLCWHSSVLIECESIHSVRKQIYRIGIVIVGSFVRREVKLLVLVKIIVRTWQYGGVIGSGNLVDK